MSYIAIILLNLFKQLIGSKGRAYYIPVDTDVETLALVFDEAINGISSADIATGGHDYNIGDTGTIDGGTVLATYKVTSVGSGGLFTGIVNGFILTSVGRGYSTGTGVTTTNTSGAGVLFTVDILALIALGTTEQLIADGNQLLNDIIPDNPYFTDGTVNPSDNDCNDGERRVGIFQYGVTNFPTTPTTAQRIAAIAQKMRYPGTNAPRQSANYLQTSLQAAGFPVYVYENLNNLTPAEILGVPAGRAFYGSFSYGEVDYGEDWSTEDITIIANSVDPLIDDDFVIPAGNNHGTFFIGGSTLGTFASIPAIQQTQFRQLVLNLKGGHMAAVTFIIFT